MGHFREMRQSYRCCVRQERIDESGRRREQSLEIRHCCAKEKWNATSNFGRASCGIDLSAVRLQHQVDPYISESKR